MFHILIPQTVNDGVQHGAYKSIEHSNDFGLFNRLVCGRSNIHAEQSPVKHSHCHQMRPTGGNGFAPPFSRMHPQDGNENEQVGNEDYKQGIGEVKSCYHKHRCFLNESVRAGKSDERRVSTVEVVDDIGATEGQAICPHGFHQATKKAIDIRTSNQTYTYPFGHLAAVKQRVTDGHVPVIGHHR